MYAPDGSLLSTTLNIQLSNAIIDPLGNEVSPESIQVTVTNGALSVELSPNLGSNPVGSYYSVSYRLGSGGPVARSTWMIPQSSTPLPLSAVVTLTPPQTPASNINSILWQLLNYWQSLGTTSTAVQQTLSSGTTDLVAPPSGVCATIFGTIYNPGSGSITVTPMFKSSAGSYYPIPFESNTVPAGQTRTFVWCGIIADPGEALSINVSGGCNFNGTSVSFNSSLGVFTMKTLSLSAGENTLYTASTIAAASTVPFVGSYGSAIGFINNSGNTVSSAQLYDVPSGQTPGSGNEISSYSVLLNGTGMFYSGVTQLNVGDSIVLSTSAPGGWAFVTVTEL